MKNFIEAKISRVKIVLSEVEGTDKVDSTHIAEYGKQFFEGKLFNPKTTLVKRIVSVHKIFSQTFVSIHIKQI